MHTPVVCKIIRELLWVDAVLNRQPFDKFGRTWESVSQFEIMEKPVTATDGIADLANTESRFFSCATESVGKS